MITPLADHQQEPIDGSAPASESSLERIRLARRWAYLLSASAYIPLSSTELEQRALGLVNHLYQAILSEPFSTRSVVGVGAQLVALNCTGQTSLRCTLEVLGRTLLTQPELQQVNRLAERVVLLLGALAADYAESVRLLTFEHQERINSALNKALRTAQRDLVLSETWFDELVTCSAGGIAITDSDGFFLRTNRTFTEIFGIADYSHKISLFDLVHPADEPCLRDAYQNLLDGDVPRLPQLRLVNPRGEAKWASFTVALLRNAEGRADRYVAMVDDRTDFSATGPQPAPVAGGLARLAHREVRALGIPSNSHFIYNVLTTITMFVRTDPARAQDLLIEFAEFTRYSAGEIGGFITLGEELRNVDRYLTLEQARFGERLQVNQQIAAAVLAVRLPFLTLQRLVENAVQHGTQGNKLGGTVTISAVDSGTDCLITIEDAGAGVDPARRLVEATAPRPEPSHEPDLRPGDLADVDERLRAAFGDDYDLVVNATPGIGTKITLRVPKSGAAR